MERLRDAGHEMVEFELEPFLQAGRMLYAGAFMAERYAAVGAYITHHPSKVNPTVSSIILSAGSIPAYAWVADIERLEGVRHQAEAAMAGLDALLMPTTLRQPSIAEVEADPIDANMPLGLYSHLGQSARHVRHGRPGRRSRRRSVRGDAHGPGVRRRARR